MNAVIEGGTIVTMGPKGTIKNGAIVVENDKVAEMGRLGAIRPKYRGYERIIAKNKVIIPGLINTHHHAAMSLLRGYADDLDLKTWLEQRIWPIEKEMTSQDIQVGALLTAIESITSGVTTINTMYHYSPDYNEAKALVEAGLRGVVGHVCFSWRKKQDLRALKSMARTWHNQNEGLVRVSVDPHSPYTVDPGYMKELGTLTCELNEKYGSDNSPIIQHIHVAETADEPLKVEEAFNINVEGGIVEYLDTLGVLSKHVVAAHCTHLTKKDIEILRKRDVKVSHNPVSNLKLASGISPVSKLLDAGVIVSLGTDSSCSNNSSDMFEVMKVAALLQKGISGDPTALSASQVLRMATIDGAKALHWDREIGAIEEGKKADLAIIDFRKPHLTPVYNEVNHIIYSGKSSDVDTVIINGKIVMENKEIKTVNVERVLTMMEKVKRDLLERVSKDF